MNKPTFHGRSALLSIACILTLTAAPMLTSPARAAAANFNLSLTTSKGCIETGDNPVFQVGELLTVTFRVGSPSVAFATTSLFDFLSDGRVGVINFGQIQTNRTFSFSARVGLP